MEETWNQAEISEDIKPVNYVNADSWNAAELNEAINLFGIKYPVDTWNPAELDEKARNIINDITSTKTATGNPISFKTINGGYAKSCEVTMLPIQDLHGQSAPYPAGGGKNKLPNPTDTTKTNGGVTVSVLNGEYTLSNTAIGNPSIVFDLVEPYTIKSGDYFHFLNNKVSNNTAIILRRQNGTSITSPVCSVVNRIVDISSFASESVYSVGFYIANGTETNFKMSPMILSTNTATSYAPYSNICPISGRDSLHLYQDTEQTETPETTHTATFPDTVYGGSNEFVSGKAKSEWGYIASYNGETITEPWISDRDVYVAGTTPSTGAEVCYKLATPTEITLTTETIELLKGNNVLWTDGDSIELKYTKLALPDDSDGLSLNQKVRKAIEIIKGKAINEELKKEETKKSTTKGRRKKS